MMNKYIMLILLVMSNFVVLSQEKISEGVVTSKQLFETNDEEMTKVLNNMKSQTNITYFKDLKTRAESSNSLSGKITYIIDGATLQSLTLIDNSLIGKKYLLTTDRVDEEGLKGLNVVKSNDTKMILGYKCEKTVVKTSQDGKDVTAIFYLTNKLPTLSIPQMTVLGGKIKGFPMRTEMIITDEDNSEMKIITEVTSVEAKKLSDDIFSLSPPEGYIEMKSKG